MNALFDVVIQRAFASRHFVHFVLKESVQSVASGYVSDGRWHRSSAFASDQISFRLSRATEMPAVSSLALIYFLNESRHFQDSSTNLWCPSRT
jgi:hypothetical protein